MKKAFLLGCLIGIIAANAEAIIRAPYVKKLDTYSTVITEQSTTISPADWSINAAITATNITSPDSQFPTVSF